MPDSVSFEKKPAHSDAPPSGVEALKKTSRGLRGGIADALAEIGTDRFSEDDAQLLKTHGVYQQYDRDTATERKKQKLDKEYMMMARTRPPGGVLTADQYQALDDLAGQLANGTLRITTRQTIQFHGVVKDDLHPLLAGINAALLTTFAACGDVVRNVMTTPAPIKDEVHDTLNRVAREISQYFLPRTAAYHEIWVDGERATGDIGKTGAEDGEPVYGAAYLPRKFKIALAHADDNSADVFTNDIGIVALFETDVYGKRHLQGFNLAVGGGHGMTHNKPQTFPRMATPLLFCKPDEVVDAVEAVIKVQRDFGDRSNRKHARLKYVVHEMGIAWVKAQTESYAGRSYDPPRAMPKFRVKDHMGWHEQGDGKLWLGVPVPSGRVIDTEAARIRSAFRALVDQERPTVVLTPTQDILFTDLDPSRKDAVETLLKDHGVVLAEQRTVFDRFAMACVALPTCGLALTEAERVRDELVDGIQASIDAHGLTDEQISLRITGCPNGCARPYAGDIGLVGRIPGHYALYVGGDFEGTRLSYRLLDKLAMADVPPVLDVLFDDFVSHRQSVEGFGDYCARAGREYLINRVADRMPSVAI